VQFDAPIIVMVCDNGIYGTIRMHQERDYPGRVPATTLKNEKTRRGLMRSVHNARRNKAMRKPVRTTRQE